MPKFQLVAERHGAVEESSTHATEEEALAVQTAFFVDYYYESWVDSMEENAEDDDEAEKVEDIPEDEIDSYVMDYFWNACRKEDGWSTWIEEIE